MHPRPPPSKISDSSPTGRKGIYPTITAIWKTLITVLNFLLEPEKDSFQEPFFNKDDENETEQERSSSRVSQTVKEWCKYANRKGECRCCLEAASHYLNGHVRDKSRIFAPSELEIFVTNDSQVPDASNCHKELHGKC